jgi:hypothetical protein
MVWSTPPVFLSGALETKTKSQSIRIILALILQWSTGDENLVNLGFSTLICIT